MNDFALIQDTRRYLSCPPLKLHGSYCSLSVYQKVCWAQYWSPCHHSSNQSQNLYDTLRTLHVIADVYARVLCVHLLCMRTLLVPCVHFCVHFRCTQCVRTVMLKTISKSFWGVSILLVNPQTFFFPTLVTGFWYLAYTSCDRRSVRLVLCVHLWCIHTLLIPCGDFCVHFLEHVYTSGTFRTLLVHAYTSVYTFGACVHFWYLAYTSGAHGVLTLLWCWQKFRSLLGYQHFAGQHKLFFFPTLVVGTLRTLHVIADVYARYSALAYTSGACVHFWYLAYTSGVCAPLLWL